MKKILIFSPGAFERFGHSYDYTKGLSGALHNLGYTIYIFGEDGPLIFPEFVHEVRIKTSMFLGTKKSIFQKIKWGFYRIRKFGKISKEFLRYYNSFEEKPYVIFETFEYFSLSIIIKKLSGKYTCVFHDTNFDFKQTSLIAGVYKFSSRIPSRIIIRNSQKVFVHGLEMKKNLIKQMGVRFENKIVDIPYGAPNPISKYNYTKYSARDKLSLNKTKNYILSFGTLRADKEYLPILEALQKTKSWEWILAGPESDYSYDEIQKMLTRLKLNSQVHFFKGFIESKDQEVFFMASDIIINLYKPFIRHESGTAQLARTYNKPVIVSGPPDLLEYVEKDNIGWIVKGDITVEKILKKYDNLTKEERGLMDSNIKELANKNSWPNISEKIISFY